MSPYDVHKTRVFPSPGPRLRQEGCWYMPEWNTQENQDYFYQPFLTPLGGLST